MMPWAIHSVANCAVSGIEDILGPGKLLVTHRSKPSEKGKAHKKVLSSIIDAEI